MKNITRSLCVVPKFRGSGGPSAFLGNLRAGLENHQFDFEDEISTCNADTILVLGGTRQIAHLLRAKSNGKRIVQRLDGMNWLHRVKWTSLKHFLRSELLNLNLAVIRRQLADVVIYQSDFTKTWWTRKFGNTNKPDTVILNGVNTTVFKPSQQPPKLKDQIRIAVVEGSFYGGHERDLGNAIDLAKAINQKTDLPVQISIAGRIPAEMMGTYTQPQEVQIAWLGEISKKFVIDLNQNSHLFFSAEINAPCPNAVLEALACGLPVLSYRTGSLAELVPKSAGQLADYGANHWRLEKPIVEPLADAALQVLFNLSAFRAGARSAAEQRFNVSLMLNRYFEILLN